MMIVLLMLAVCYCQEFTFDSDVPPLQLSTQHNSTQSLNIPTNQLLSLNFTNIHYQYTYELWTSTSQLKEQQVLNSSAYDYVSERVNPYCTLYPTNVETNKQSSVTLASSPLYHYAHESSKNSMLYVWAADGILYQYGYDHMNVWYLRKWEGVLVEGERVRMVGVDHTLLIFGEVSGAQALIDGEFKPFSPNHTLTTVLHAGVYNSQGNPQFYLSDGYSLSVGHLINSDELISLPNITDALIQDIHVHQLDGISLYTTQIYLLTPTKLHHLTLNSAKVAREKVFDLEGECSDMEGVGSILYIVCEYERIPYVMEIGLVVPHRYLNRYYDDRHVEGLWHVTKLGENLVALVGNTELMVVSAGVNREALLELYEKQKQERFDIIYQRGLVGLYMTPSSQFLHVSLLAINESAVSIVQVYTNPPELQCRFGEHITEATVTVLFNTTTCPSHPPESNIQRVCQVSYSYNIHVGDVWGKDKAGIAIFAIVLGLSTVGLIMMGWFLKKYTVLQSARSETEVKLQRISQRESVRTDDTLVEKNG